MIDQFRSRWLTLEGKQLRAAVLVRLRDLSTATDLAVPAGWSPITDLGGLDLRGLDLHGLELSDVDWGYVRLQYANLSGSTFFHARLDCAVIDEADFSKVVANEMRLDCASGRRANFEGANLEGADLSSGDFTAASFCCSRLRGAQLSRCKLTDANFSGADLAGADFYGIQLRTAPDTIERIRSAGGVVLDVRIPPTGLATP